MEIVQIILYILYKWNYYTIIKGYSLYDAHNLESRIVDCKGTIQYTLKD